jgi:hypothetical protein
MGIFSVFLGVFNYSADCYYISASSALAAQGLCENMAAGSLPLITNQLFNNLGFQAARSLHGDIGLALTLVPWVLVFYGPKVRSRSKIASSSIAWKPVLLRSHRALGEGFSVKSELIL